MRRGARWTLVIGAALAATALGHAARAEVHSLGACFGSCFAPPIEDQAAAKNDTAAKTTLSRSGKTGQPNDRNPALTFDRRALPSALVGGLPSPLASAGARAPPDDSPYDYFEDVIDIPLPAEARTEFAEASFFLFAPSLLGRLTEVLSAGAAPSGKDSPPPM